MAKKRKIRKTRLRRNPSKREIRLAKNAIIRARNKAKLASYSKKKRKPIITQVMVGKKNPPIPKRRAKNVRIVHAKRNPYMPYLIYGDARPHRAKAGRVARYYWTGYKFTTDKKYAEHFPNAESAFNTCKRIRNRLPDRLEFIAVQRVT